VSVKPAIKQSTARIMVSVLTVAMTLAAGIGTVFLLFTVPFMFDAPGSANDLALLFLAQTLWFFPLTCFLAVVGSWTFYFRKKYNGALMCSLLPMLNLFLIGIAACLIWLREVE
jgi:hypothetical protein